MRFLRRLWNLVRRGRLDDDLKQELDTHLALIEEEERHRGLSPDEAYHAARLRFGIPRAHREQALENVTAHRVEQTIADLRHAVRLLARSPGFTLTAVLSLALGIGVNSAMFSVIEAVLVRPLPYEQPSRLVALQQKSGLDGSDLTYPEYEVVRDQSRVFASVAASGLSGPHRLEWAGGEAWIQTVSVTADFLRTLGTPLALGRAIDAAETQADGPPAIVLSTGTWRGTFGADPSIVGQMVRLDGAPSIVVGVLSPRFWLPQPADALVPLRPTGGPTDHGTNTDVVARLQPGVSLERAQAAVAALTDRLRRADGRQSPYDGLAVRPMHAALVSDVRAHLLLLFGATGMLLALACVNLAMLLMTRFAARAKEIALRVALGNGQRRLFAQFLAENLTLAALGAAVSIAAAYALVSGAVASIPFDLPAAEPIRIDGGVLLFALAVAVGMALLLTLVPLAVARRLNVQHALRSTSRTAGQDDVRGRARNFLIIAEVALSTMLLIGAGLLIHSLYQLGQERLGFDPHDLTTFVTPLDRHPAGPDRTGFLGAMTARLQQIPGVRGIAVANVLPLAGWSNLPTEWAGHPEQGIGGMEIRAVSPDYFTILGIALQDGRRFTAADATGTPPVAMINQTLARIWWPGGSAIGDRVVVGLFRGRRFGDDAPREVVGIVADTKDRALTHTPSPTVFVPVGQAVGFDSSMSWLIKADRSPTLASVRTAVSAVDPGQRLLKLRTMDDIVAATTATSRFDTLLFGLLAAVGVVLAVVGLYGVLSFVVARRRQEIGVRVALGAGRGQVFGMFLRQGVALTAVGLLLGIGGSLLLTRWLSVLLYEVKGDDPASFTAVAVLFLVIGGVASSLPARRAATMDAVETLRAE